MHSYEEFDDFIWCVKKPKKILQNYFVKLISKL